MEADERSRHCQVLVRSEQDAMTGSHAVSLLLLGCGTHCTRLLRQIYCGRIRIDLVGAELYPNLAYDDTDAAASDRSRGCASQKRAETPVRLGHTINALSH